MTKGRSILAALFRVFGKLLIFVVVLVALPSALPRFWGYEAYNIVSGSMEPEMPVGSAAYVKYVDPIDIEEGEVIAFLSRDSVIIHRVVVNDTTQLAIITKGDANEGNDMNPISYNDVLGVVDYHVPFIGSVMVVATSFMGKIYLMAVLVAGVVLQLLGTVLGKKAEADEDEEFWGSSEEDHRPVRLDEPVRVEEPVRVAEPEIEEEPELAPIRITDLVADETPEVKEIVFEKLIFPEEEAVTEAGFEGNAAPETGFEEEEFATVPVNLSVRKESPWAVANATFEKKGSPWAAANATFEKKGKAPKAPKPAKVKAEKPVKEPKERKTKEPKEKSSAKSKILITTSAILFAGFAVVAGLIIKNRLDYAQDRAVDEVAVEEYTRPAAVAADEVGEVCPIEVDFEDLQEVNPEVIGWIYLEDSDINFPILQAEDNDYYLEHSWEGKTKRSGAIFLEMANKADFSDTNSIIYGHHMKDGSMFAGLDKFRDQEYYDAHDTMWLLTPDATYKILVFSAYTTSAYSDSYTVFRDYGPVTENYINQVWEASNFSPNYEKCDILTDGDFSQKYIMLATCAYNFEEARFVLHGKLIEQ
ncbi:MAG: class B sortase [Pseudobutyrivibrio sp.]|nr:class B sortase [Pseudobutyrivibrio sp.]